MPYSDTVDSYLPVKSIEVATKEYQEYFQNTHVTENFMQDLVRRRIIKSRTISSTIYIHPSMFDDWLIQHKNKSGRPYQKEDYMDAIDIRKDFEETESYYNFLPKDIEVLLENNLIGNSMLLEKNRRYILRNELDLFYTKDKLFCHTDIVNLLHSYIHENFGTTSVDISEILGFDIDKIVYRGYITPTYFSESKINHAYLSTEPAVNICLSKLKKLIQKSAKIKKLEQIEEGFHFRFTNALTHKALLVNRLKPFSLPSTKIRNRDRQKLQEKFTTVNKFKKFLQHEIESIDINTNLKGFISQLKELVPFDHDTPIHSKDLKRHLDEISIPFDREIEMYEEALLDNKKIF